MIRFAPCKINLGLHVIEKRPDGYHNLETCFFPVPWYDVIEVVPAEFTQLTMSGSEVPGDPRSNLCMRAYELLRTAYALPPVAMHLHKSIPTGAGLGGGSADGAHMLRALNERFELKLSQADLLTYAAQLGSDCPFFLFDEPLLGTGRGEVLSPVAVTLKAYFLVVVKPPVHVSTAEAYAGIEPKIPRYGLRDVLARPLHAWRDMLVNDFEQSVFRKFPQLGEIKDHLYALGARYASMSGSGAAVFGIFEEPVDLRSRFGAALQWAGRPAC